mgnify:CR=1 FL=1
MRGKWAEGIQPRGRIWIVKDRLAVCERPGGYGPQHRKVRRVEELIWIRRNDFKRVISIIPATHNLHNYEEFDIDYVHRPVAIGGHLNTVLSVLYSDLNKLIKIRLEEDKDYLLENADGNRLSTNGLTKLLQKIFLNL